MPSLRESTLNTSEDDLKMRVVQQHRAFTVVVRPDMMSKGGRYNSNYITVYQTGKGIKSNLRDKIYRKGQDEKGNYTKQVVNVIIKGKKLL